MKKKKLIQIAINICVLFALLFCISSKGQAQNIIQIANENFSEDGKPLAAYEHYYKKKITLADYTGDTLKQLFNFYSEKSEKEYAQYYSIAYPVGSHWVCEDYDLYEKKLCRYVTFADKELSKLDGPFFFFYSDEKVRRSGFYNNGMIDGPWVTYYENGKLKDTAFYINGIRVGKGLSFYPSGKVRKISGLDVQGSGIEKRYYEDGKLFQEGVYGLYNLKDSVWSAYYPDGKISYHETFNMGTVKETICYNHDGSPKSHCEVRREPRFPGGQEAFDKFIERHLDWPNYLRFDKVSAADAIATFVVDVDGSLMGIKITKHLVKEFDQEVLLFVKRMPKWEPAMEYGQPVRAVYEWRITFRQFHY